ncbi:pilus assembly FimT family protein [Roseibacillus persicicus]|uniref:pilus assembly FimT family protein n=1 Tax=Roseibacillus persicicus TaxID=454148 RepID=UPI001672C879|nr:type II secretion system protein [Roseibacillus persicicus]MDQ8192043.1 type II secretion system protein [Roseibacillus persicicus]
MKKRAKTGFTLIEVLVVMGIMAVFLVMGAFLFQGAGKSESRDAVRSLLLAGLNNAQTRALSSGEPVAMVMTPYDQGLEDRLGRAFTLFEVRQDDVTGDFIAGKQLRRWADLPGRFIFSKGGTVSDSGQNAFDQEAVVTISVRDDNSPQKRSVEMPAIIFGSTGSVIWPSGEAELELHVGEGTVQNGVAVGTGADNNDWRKREVIIIGRQTGRARYLQTQ